MRRSQRDLSEEEEEEERAEGEEEGEEEEEREEGGRGGSDGKRHRVDRCHAVIKQISDLRRYEDVMHRCFWHATHTVTDAPFSLS